MDIQFYGANCIVLTIKGARIVLDDNLTALGAKSVLKAGDIALYTGEHKAPTVETKLTIDHAGEYEAAGVSIYGIPARAHMDEPGKQTATMYKVISSGITVLVTGHIYPELTDEQLEAINMVDVMLVPVGGSGYTLDPIGAQKLIRKIEPKLVVPVHYADKALNFEVPQQDLATALTELAMEPKETTSKLRVKESDLRDLTQLVVLEKS
jgi:L-ascorbate metabolism protein UlaG (beta-lactamase superfamily)